MALSRVRLPACDEAPEEFGELLGKLPYDDIWVIRIDPQYRIYGDDGFRRLRRSQFEFV